MPRFILIGLAGFVGTLARYWLSGVVARRYGDKVRVIHYKSSR